MANAEPLDRVFIERTVEAAIRIAVIAVLVVVVLHHREAFPRAGHLGRDHRNHRFPGLPNDRSRLGGRRTPGRRFDHCPLLVVLVVPSILLGNSLVTGVNSLMDPLRAANSPSRRRQKGVARWPLVGEPISRFWTVASQDLGQALRQASPLFKHARRMASECGSGRGIALLQLVLAIFISGAFLSHSKKLPRASLEPSRTSALRESVD